MKNKKRYNKKKIDDSFNVVLNNFGSLIQSLKSNIIKTILYIKDNPNDNISDHLYNLAGADNIISMLTNSLELIGISSHLYNIKDSLTIDNAALIINNPNIVKFLETSKNDIAEILVNILDNVDHDNTQKCKNIIKLLIDIIRQIQQDKILDGHENREQLSKKLKDAIDNANKDFGKESYQQTLNSKIFTLSKELSYLLARNKKFARIVADRLFPYKTESIYKDVSGIDLTKPINARQLYQILPSLRRAAISGRPKSMQNVVITGDISGHNLSGLDLRSINFSQAKMVGKDVDGNIKKVNLEMSDLSNCIIDYHQLQELDWSNLLKENIHDILKRDLKKALQTQIRPYQGWMGSWDEQRNELIDVIINKILVSLVTNDNIDGRAIDETHIEPLVRQIVNAVKANKEIADQILERGINNHTLRLSGNNMTVIEAINKVVQGAANAAQKVTLPSNIVKKSVKKTSSQLTEDTRESIAYFLQQVNLDEFYLIKKSNIYELTDLLFDNITKHEQHEYKTLLKIIENNKAAKDRLLSLAEKSLIDLKYNEVRTSAHLVHSFIKDIKQNEKIFKFSEMSNQIKNNEFSTPSFNKFTEQRKNTINNIITIVNNVGVIEKFSLRLQNRESNFFGIWLRKFIRRFFILPRYRKLFDSTEFVGKLINSVSITDLPSIIYNYQIIYKMLRGLMPILSDLGYRNDWKTPEERRKVLLNIFINIIEQDALQNLLTTTKNSQDIPNPKLISLICGILEAKRSTVEDDRQRAIKQIKNKIKICKVKLEQTTKEENRTLLKQNLKDLKYNLTVLQQRKPNSTKHNYIVDKEETKQLVNYLIILNKIINKYNLPCSIRELFNSKNSNKLPDVINQIKDDLINNVDPEDLKEVMNAVHFIYNKFIASSHNPQDIKLRLTPPMHMISDSAMNIEFTKVQAMIKDDKVQKDAKGFINLDKYMSCRELIGTQITEANFNNVRASKIQFWNTVFNDTSFDNSRLSGFPYKEVNPQKYRFQGANFLRSTFNKGSIINAEMPYAIFTAAQFRKTKIAQSNFTSGNFNDAEMQDLVISSVNFSKISGIKINLINTVLDECEFIHANLTNAFCYGIKIKSSKANNAMMRGANLARVEISDSSFVSSDLSSSSERQTSFADGIITNTSFACANITNLNCKGTIFKNINFRKANMIDIVIDGNTKFTGDINLTDALLMSDTYKFIKNSIEKYGGKIIGEPKIFTKKVSNSIKATNHIGRDGKNGQYHQR